MTVKDSLVHSPRFVADKPRLKSKFSRKPDGFSEVVEIFLELFRFVEIACQRRCHETVECRSIAHVPRVGVLRESPMLHMVAAVCVAIDFNPRKSKARN